MPAHRLSYLFALQLDKMLLHAFYLAIHLGQPDPAHYHHAHDRYRQSRNTEVAIGHCRLDFSALLFLLQPYLPPFYDFGRFSNKDRSCLGAPGNSHNTSISFPLTLIRLVDFFYTTKFCASASRILFKFLLRGFNRLSQDKTGGRCAITHAYREIRRADTPLTP